jgi:putative hydrolase of the HAD superfamily
VRNHLFRAVLFDFFGTLTRAVQRGRAHADIARSLGCDPDEFVAVLDRTFRLRATGVHGSAEESLGWVCRQLGVRPSAEQLRQACRARVAALRADTRMRPDAMSALWAVRRRGLRTGLISDCGYELPQFLPDLPIAPMLNATVFSVHIGVCKPHEAIYLAACVRLGVNPWQCLYVGDGGGRELSGAEQLGMTAVRLAAADLDRHLSFENERDWTGRAAPTLMDAVANLDGVDTAHQGRIAQRFGTGARVALR